MDTLLQFVNLVLHIDKFLGVFISEYGAWIYAVLFLIVFCETGLVVMPFLPGDSLLFIGGAFCASGDMNLGLLIVLLVVAAVSGNTVNYLIGKAIGPKVFDSHIPLLETLPRSRRAAEDAQLLRETRRQDHRAGPLYPGGADLRAVCCGGVADERPPFPVVQYRRRAVLGVAACAARFFLREHPVYPPVSET